MATSDQVQQLYITYFGRPADPSGLAYWTADSATPLSTIAQGFATTPEFAADIEGRTLDQIVNSFYVDLFGRNAEPGGLAFWVNQIQIGNTTIQQAGLEISNAALTTEARGNADNVALVSKIAAADRWTATTAASTAATLAYTGNIGIQAGVNFLLPVLTTATIPTEEATEAQIAALVQANGSGVGSTLELSIFTDVATDTGTVRLDNNASIQESSLFRFTAGNQTVNGTAATFSGITANPDRLIDGFTTDQDVLNVSGLTTGFAAQGGNATVTNIENINYAFTNATGAAGVIGNVTGAQNFTFAGTVADAGNLSLAIANSGATSFTSSLTGANTTTFTLTTGALAETITTSDVSDSITSDAGNDTIVSAGGNDTILSGAGADSVSAGAGDDTITLGAGNDTVDSGTGADQITDAGNGNDTILHSSAASTVAAAVTGTGTVTVTASQAGFTSTSAAGVNTTVDASSSSASVTLNGDGGADTLTGGSASDRIDGAGGADSLVGNAGNDTITGGAANDNMTGGTGADQFVQNANGVSTVASVISGVDSDISTGAAVWTFGNGVDVVTDFVGGTDEILSTAGGLVATNNLLFGQAVDATSVVAGNYVVQGTWDGAAGTFTYGNGADVMFGFAGGTLATIGNNGTRSAILVGGAAGFVAGDIV